MEHLIAKCRKHNPKAQRELYNMFAAKMLGVCLRYAPDRSTAQDMLQEGYIKVFTKLHDLRNPNVIESWIYHIIVSTCINYLNRQLKYYEAVDEMTGSDQEPLIDEDPYAAEELMAAVAALPVGQRLAFNLREVEGFGYDEIAAAMRCPESTVRSLLCRAKINLRETLSDIKH
ncbi:MAG: sigma-70 family RNA polymerase sigma factor [Bacteroidales bacterium]|nr:sigma-70 family RNA polymerase sigma factor [Bacteroidales bacterium]